MLSNLWLFLKTHSPIFYLTQPLWRDEAFAFLLALKSPFEIISLSTADFTPPLFYLLLHYWIKLFGHSEIAVRLLSFIFHIGTVYTVYKFSGQIAKKIQIAVAILTLVNPMLLYYAFEARAYSLLALLSVTSIYAFYTQRSKLLILINILGLYTHYYFILIILVELLYVIYKHKFLNKVGFVFLIPLIFFLPWMPFLVKQITMAAADSWYFPVDRQLWLASLGTIFTGFTGTPSFIWRQHQVLTLFILTISLLVLRKNKAVSKLLLFWLLVPPLTLLTISLLKPIWYNRYLIHVAVGETIIIALFIFQLPRPARNLAFVLTLIGIIAFNLWFPPFIAKTDYRTPLTKLRKQVSASDTIVATDPIHFFETKYYLLGTQNTVNLLNLPGKAIPAYLGTAIIEKEDIINELPEEKMVYLINKDGSIECLTRKN